MFRLGFVGVGGGLGWNAWIHKIINPLSELGCSYSWISMLLTSYHGHVVRGLYWGFSCH